MEFLVFEAVSRTSYSSAYLLLILVGISVKVILTLQGCTEPTFEVAVAGAFGEYEQVVSGREQLRLESSCWCSVYEWYVTEPSIVEAVAGAFGEYEQVHRVREVRLESMCRCSLYERYMPEPTIEEGVAAAFGEYMQNLLSKSRWQVRLESMCSLYEMYVTEPTIEESVAAVFGEYVQALIVRNVCDKTYYRGVGGRCVWRVCTGAQCTRGICQNLQLRRVWRLRLESMCRCSVYERYMPEPTVEEGVAAAIGEYVQVLSVREVYARTYS
ncbi:hypothetical protein J6590_095723 [Homalodisca vitripennis]|nr:hypothetical protein J6590_095723 [Homalodisca vitripennis]